MVSINSMLKLFLKCLNVYGKIMKWNKLINGEITTAKYHNVKCQEVVQLTTKFV